MVIWKPITTEANLHASTVSNIGLSRYVRLLNTSAVATQLVITLKNVGGTTIQQKKMPKFKKVLREITRPIWQFVAFITYKSYRAIRNYSFYRKH